MFYTFAQKRLINLLLYDKVYIIKIGDVASMYSMTGFGKAEYKNGYEITVEIKTVNNRFLDVLPKYPKSFVAFDDLIRKTVQSKITRG